MYSRSRSWGTPLVSEFTILQVTWKPDDSRNFSERRKISANSASRARAGTCSRRKQRGAVRARISMPFNHRNPRSSRAPKRLPILEKAWHGYPASCKSTPRRAGSPWRALARCSLTSSTISTFASCSVSWTFLSRNRVLRSFSVTMHAACCIPRWHRACTLAP